jgi:hypothetical protein
MASEPMDTDEVQRRHRAFAALGEVLSFIDGW